MYVQKDVFFKVLCFNTSKLSLKRSEWLFFFAWSPSHFLVSVEEKKGWKSTNEMQETPGDDTAMTQKLVIILMIIDASTRRLEPTPQRTKHQRPTRSLSARSSLNRRPQDSQIFVWNFPPPPQKKNNNSMPGCLSVVFKTGEYNQLKKQW